MITSITDLYSALQEIVATATQVDASRVIVADQGRPPPEPQGDLYVTYKPVPVRAYGHPRKDRELTPAEETGPTQNWEDYAETTVTQLELLVSVNCMNEGAREAAWKLHNAGFRQVIRELTVANEIGWRYVSEIRDLTAIYQAGAQPRYQADINLYVETAITDTILRAAAFSFEVEDEDGNIIATGEG